MSVPNSEAHAELQTVLIYGSLTVLLIIVLFFVWIIYNDKKKNDLKLLRKTEAPSGQATISSRRRKIRKK